MEEKEFKLLSNQELLDEEKKLDSFSITNAFLIGFLGGILIVALYFGAVWSALVIPIFLIYKLTNDSRNKKIKELKLAKKERSLD